jgi:hypothetical protein
MLYVGIIVFLLGGLFIFLGQKKKKTQTEMSKTKSVSINQLQPNQQAEIQGTIVVSHPLQTPFSKRDCVYYEYKLERETQTKDSQGRSYIRWERVSENKNSMPFWLQDATGRVAVYPENAQVEAQPLGELFVQQGDILQNQFLKNVVNLLTGYNTKVSESALFTNSPAYVFGYVTQGQQGLAIQKGQGGFVISYKSEEQVEKSMARSAILLKVLGVLAIIGGIAFFVYALVK